MHFTFTSNDNKKPYQSTIFNPEQSSDRQFEVEPTPVNNTFGNVHIFQNNMLNRDNFFNSNKSESIQNRKRKRFNNQTCLAQKDNKNLNNVSQQEYITKSQNQEDKQNYAEINQEKMEIVQNIFPKLKKKDKNLINLNENENVRSEKRKRSQNITSLEEYDAEKKRKNEYYKHYREKNADKIKGICKKYYETHTDKIKKYNENAGQKKRKKEYDKKYRKQNEDKLKQKKKKIKHKVT
jgi:hypothetical protein